MCVYELLFIFVCITSDGLRAFFNFCNTSCFFCEHVNESYGTIANLVKRQDRLSSQARHLESSTGVCGGVP